MISSIILTQHLGVLFKNFPWQWETQQLSLIYFFICSIKKNLLSVDLPVAVFVAYHFQTTSSSALTGLGLCNPHPFLAAVSLLTSAIVLTPACWKQKGKQDGKERAGSNSLIFHRYYSQPCHIFFRISFIFKISSHVVAWESPGAYSFLQSWFLFSQKGNRKGLCSQ